MLMHVLRFMTWHRDLVEIASPVRGVRILGSLHTHAYRIMIPIVVSSVCHLDSRGFPARVGYLSHCSEVIWLPFSHSCFRWHHQHLHFGVDIVAFIAPALAISFTQMRVAINDLGLPLRREQFSYVWELSVPVK